METQITPAIQQWVNIGETMRKKNQHFVDLSKNIIESHPSPTTVGEVDGVVKSLTSKLNEVISERKDVTRIFDNIAEKLMQPEKAIAAHLGVVKQAGLTLKIAEEKRINEINIQKQKNAAEIEAIKKAILDYKVDFVTRSTAYINKCYMAALESKANDMNIVMNAIKPTNIFLPAKEFSPENKMIYVLTEHEVDAMLNTYFNTVESVYNNFDVDVENIEKAKQDQEKKAKELEAKLQLKVEQKKDEISFTTMLESEPEVLQSKATKRSFAIDVTENNHCQIALAYATNYDTLKHYMTAKKYESLTIGQMANYLCKAKADGVIIEIDGIVYNSVQKI